MSVVIPPFYQALLTSSVSATLSVLAADGTIQSTLVWPDYDGEYIKLNMTDGSPKVNNLRREGRATILVAKPNDENFYLSVRVVLARIESVGAIAHLNHLTRRHYGLGSWFGDVEPADSPNKNKRIVAYLRPERIYCSK